MQEPVGVAVVGVGYWGPNLVRSFRACDATRLVAVCDLNLERARRVVGRSTSARVTDDLASILDDPSITAVAVATPIRTHHAIGMACLAAGKHLLVEKPLAATVAQGEALVAAAQEAGRVLMCDHTFCYTAAVERIRDEVKAGTLGTIQYVDSVRINLGLVQPDANVFWDLLPHDVSILDSVLPGFAPVAVAAVGVDPIGAGQLCVGYATLILPDDAIAHVHLSWLSPVKIRTVVVGGSERHLVWDDVNPARRISIYERGVNIDRRSTEDQREEMVRYRRGDMHAPALAETEALVEVVTEFARAIREHDAPLTDGQAGLRVLRVLAATDASLAAGGALVAL